MASAGDIAIYQNKKLAEITKEAKTINIGNYRTETGLKDKLSEFRNRIQKEIDQYKIDLGRLSEEMEAEWENFLETVDSFVSMAEEKLLGQFKDQFPGREVPVSSDEVAKDRAFKRFMEYRVQDKTFQERDHALKVEEHERIESIKDDRHTTVLKTCATVGGAGVATALITALAAPAVGAALLTYGGAGAAASSAGVAVTDSVVHASADVSTPIYQPGPLLEPPAELISTNKRDTKYKQLHPSSSSQ